MVHRKKKANRPWKYKEVDISRTYKKYNMYTNHITERNKNEIIVHKHGLGCHSSSMQEMIQIWRLSSCMWLENHSISHCTIVQLYDIFQENVPLNIRGIANIKRWRSNLCVQVEPKQWITKNGQVYVICESHNPLTKLYIVFCWYFYSGKLITRQSSNPPFSALIWFNLRIEDNKTPSAYGYQIVFWTIEATIF